MSRWAGSRLFKWPTGADTPQGRTSICQHKRDAPPSRSRLAHHHVDGPEKKKNSSDCAQKMPIEEEKKWIKKKKNKKYIQPSQGILSTTVFNSYGRVASIKRASKLSTNVLRNIIHCTFIYYEKRILRIRVTIGPFRHSIDQLLWSNSKILQSIFNKSESISRALRSSVVRGTSSISFHLSTKIFSACNLY